MEGGFAVGIHKSVVTDFHEAGGQHVLQEAADELDNIEGQDSRSFTVRLAIANQHGAVLDANNARVGDGDFEDVGGEILERGLTGAHRLAVHVPGDLPDGKDFTDGGHDRVPP